MALKRPRRGNRWEGDPAKWRNWIAETDPEEVRAVVTDAIEAYDAATPNRYQPPRGILGEQPDLVEAVRARLIGRDPEALLDDCAHLLDVGVAGSSYPTSAEERAWPEALTLLRRVMYVEPWFRRTARQRNLRT